MIAHQHTVSVDDAFALLRGYARTHQRGIAEVAADIVGRQLTI